MIKIVLLMIPFILIFPDKLYNSYIFNNTSNVHEISSINRIDVFINPLDWWLFKKKRDEIYERGLKDGYNQKESELQNYSKNLRGMVRSELKSKLSLGSVLIVIVILFGSELFQWTREKIKFIIPNLIQKYLAICLYSMFVIYFASYFIINFNDLSITVFVFLSGSLYPFLNLIWSIDKEDKFSFKINFSKIKIIIFCIIVIYVLDNYLSDVGFLGLRL